MRHEDGTTAKEIRTKGARPKSGRKPAGRRQIVLRIKGEIIDQLEPGAARKMRDIIERKFKSP
jgi:hypothetical protein